MITGGSTFEGEEVLKRRMKEKKRRTTGFGDGEGCSRADSLQPTHTL